MLKIVSAYNGVADYIQAARKNPETEWSRLWMQFVIDAYWDQWAAGEHNEARTRQELSHPIRDLDGLEREVNALAESGVEEVVRTAYECICRLLPYHEGDTAICIMAASSQDQEIVGTCIGANTLLTVNQARQDWQQWVKYVLAHERHHSAWGYHYYYICHGSRQDLLISLISEGAADSFAHLVCPDLRPGWIDALTAEEEAKQWKAIQPLLNTAERSDELHRRFFFGDQEKEVPPFTGYTIGYHIVQKYLNLHPGESVADWTLKDPQVIFGESGYSGRL